MPQPLYSSDLAPVDFILFSKVKTTLKGRRFDRMEAIQESITLILNAIFIENFEVVY